MDLCEGFTRDESSEKEVTIKFCISSASVSESRNFTRILRQCKIGHFSQFGSDVWKTERIFVKIFLQNLRTRNSPLNHRSHPDLYLGLGVFKKFL